MNNDQGVGRWPRSFGHSGLVIGEALGIGHSPKGCAVGLFSRLFGGGKGKKGPAVKKKKKEKLPVTDVSKRFELRGRTGQGSMSKVYHAYDNNLGRMVCLKILDKAKTATFEA